MSFPSGAPGGLYITSYSVSLVSFRCFGDTNDFVGLCESGGAGAGGGIKRPRTTRSSDCEQSRRT